MKQEKSKRFLMSQKSRSDFLGCPVCQKGKMEKKKDIMEQDGIEFESYKCLECGEGIMNMKQLRLLASKYRKLRQAKDIIFAKWGNSIAVRIPSDIADEYNISVGKHGTLTKDKEGIKIIPT
jgi:ssDNA-binding Zn-finger/Zn-ribbon topoisomerase 1